MKCPVCSSANLVMSDRQGIEIDYCPECRGVWLDRGELDKIIERSSEPPAQQRDEEREPRYEGREPRYESRDPKDYKHRKKKKREGLLDKLFDF